MLSGNGMLYSHWVLQQLCLNCSHGCWRIKDPDQQASKQCDLPGHARFEETDARCRYQAQRARQGNPLQQVGRRGVCGQRQQQVKMRCCQDSRSRV